MTVGARIVFTSLRSSEPARLRSWLDHASRLVAPHAVQSSVDDGVVWQLTSANHRMIARSALVHDSFESAHDAVLEVRQGLDRVVVRTVKLSSSPVYGWYGVLDKALVLTCARWYSTVRDTRDSLRDAMVALATAPVEEAPRQVAGSRGGR